MDGMMNNDQLTQAQSDYEDQRRKQNTIGAIGDALANQQSFGNFFLGRMNPHNDVSGTIRSNADESPMDRQKKLLAAYRDQKESQKLDREDNKEIALDKSDSPETQALYDSFAKAGIQVKPGMTANQITAAYGKPAEYALAKFKEQQERATKLAVANQKAPRGMTWQVADDGTRTLVPLAGAAKPNQYTAAQFGIRADQADKEMSDLLDNGYDPTSLGSGIQRASFLGIGVPERFKQPEVKQEEQAERNFVNAILRRESGAAISDSEFDSARKQYFAQPGDDAKTLAQKAQNRRTASAALRAESGPAWQEVAANMNQIPARSFAAKPQGNGGFIGDAQAGPAITERDLAVAAEVQKRLQNNPQDPKALAALQKLRAKGLK
jgi:hypothetical protein